MYIVKMIVSMITGSLWDAIYGFEVYRKEKIVKQNEEIKSKNGRCPCQDRYFQIFCDNLNITNLTYSDDRNFADMLSEKYLRAF